MRELTVKLPTRYWDPAMATTSAGVLTAAALAVPQLPRTPETAAFIVLMLGAEWFRLQLSPGEDTTLAPMLVVTLLLLRRPDVAVVALSIATLAVRTGWFREPGRRTLAALGQNGFPLLLAMLTPGTVWHPDSQTAPLPIAAVAIYLLLILLGMTARAVIVEHVWVQQYLAVPFRRVLGHLAVAGVGGVALWVVHQRLGIILTAMTAWVIGQLYYPVKILADKRRFSLGILGAIASAVDLKDPYTARHSRNVAEYSAKIARRLGLPEDEVERIRLGALLHDIGKIGVGGRIIRKPGMLDPEERLTMQAHVDRSADLLEPLALVGEAAEIVRAHHEHFDGTGYPRGLKGGEIPLGARIILVADAFDAMTTDRPYRRGRLPREALQALRAHAGRQFDPAVVQALDQIISE